MDWKTAGEDREPTDWLDRSLGGTIQVLTRFTQSAEENHCQVVCSD